MGRQVDLILRYAGKMGISPDKAVALAHEQIRLAGEPNLREAVGRNARSLAESGFDQKKLPARFVAFVEEVAKDRLLSS